MSDQELYERFSRLYYRWWGKALLPEEFLLPSPWEALVDFVKVTPDIGKIRDEMRLGTPLHLVARSSAGTPTLDSYRAWWRQENDDLPSVESFSDEKFSEAIKSSLGEMAQKRADLIRLLLARGAEIDARDEAGMTPLLRAIQRVRWLSQDITNDSTERMMAFSNDQQAPIIELLLQRGASSDARDLTGSTPMHFAAVTGHQTLFFLLLQAGADADAVDGIGISVRDTARGAGWGELLVDRYLDAK